MRKNLTATIALTGILAAMSLISFMIESLLPPLILPGAKIGLSNVFSLTAVIVMGPIEGLAVVIVKSVLGGIFSGNPFSIAYSLAAGVMAISVSYILIKLFSKKLSLLPISVISAAAHNGVQITVYSLMTTMEGMKLMPYYLIVGCVSGFLVGIITVLILKGIPLSVYKKNGLI